MQQLQKLLVFLGFFFLAIFRPATAQYLDAKHQIFYVDNRGVLQHVTNTLGDVWVREPEEWNPNSLKFPPNVAVLIEGRITNIYFRDPQGLIQRYWRDDGGIHGPEVANEGAARAAGDPSTMATANQRHIFYRDDAGVIRHIWWTNGRREGPDTWMGYDHILAVGNPGLMTSPDQQHMFFRGTDGQIWHNWYTNNRPTIGFDSWMGGGPKAAGDPTAIRSQIGQLGQQHFFYRDLSGLIQHYWYNENNRRHPIGHDQWNNGGVAAAGDPAAVESTGRQNVYYPDANGLIREVYYDEGAARLRSGVLDASLPKPAGRLSAVYQPETMCRDYDFAHNGNKSALLPLCEATYRRVGCNVDSPSGLLDTTNRSCSTSINLSLPSNYIACGATAFVSNNSLHGMISPPHFHENTVQFDVSAQGANHMSGGQDIWADVAIRGYRNDVAMTPAVKATFCTSRHVGGNGVPWGPSPGCTCIHPPGQPGPGVWLGCGQAFGICYNE